MYRRGFFVRLVLALLLVALLFAGGYFAYRSGWSQGYQTATLQASGEGMDAGAVIPPFRGLYYASYMPGFGFPFLGLCVGIGLIFLVMFLIGGILKPWGWRRWGRYSHYGLWKHEPMPPWAKDWEEHQRKSSRDEGEGKQSQDDQPAAI